ncbi:MAG TPA: hypothetical protein VK507_05895 [Iamia sp.]|nr:hypothetical protein [Iamia sp.]
MSDDKRLRPQDVPAEAVEPLSLESFARLQIEVTRLRRQIEGEMRTRGVVVVDRDGVERIRLSADEGGCRVALLAPDGFERLALEEGDGHGALHIAGRSERTDPTRVDVFAVDPEDEQGVYVGIELVDGGNSVAGFTTIESRAPRTWTARP